MAGDGHVIDPAAPFEVHFSGGGGQGVTGSAGGKKVVIQSTSPYTQTGLFQAAAAVKLMTDGPEKAGFAGPAQAVGHRYMLNQLKTFLPVKVTVTDI